MNLTELKRFLAELNVRPKKGLSQNFLIDQNCVNKLLDVAGVCEAEQVLEIGPGPGAITESLVKRGAQVEAVELDPIFAEALKRFPVTIYQADILSFPLENLKGTYKVVANLPYHITAPILTRLVPRRDLFSTITVIVQEEVARRLTAKPGTRAYGSLTVFLHFYAQARYAFSISRSCFYPAPKVDSAVVTFLLQEPPDLDAESFFKFVRTAFQQRRKMLKKNLAALYASDAVCTALESLGMNPKVRAEELSLTTFISLFKLLN